MLDGTFPCLVGPAGATLLLFNATINIDVVILSGEVSPVPGFRLLGQGSSVRCIRCVFYLSECNSLAVRPLGAQFKVRSKAGRSPRACIYGRTGTLAQQRSLLASVRAAIAGAKRLCGGRELGSRGAGRRQGLSAAACPLHLRMSWQQHQQQQQHCPSSPAHC